MIPQVLLMCHIWRKKNQGKNRWSIHPIKNSLQDCKTLKSYFAKERTKLEIIFHVTEAGISSELSFYVQLKYSFILKIWEVSVPLTSFPTKETYARLIFRVIDLTLFFVFCPFFLSSIYSWLTIASGIYLSFQHIGNMV